MIQIKGAVKFPITLDSTTSGFSMIEKLASKI